MNALTSYLRHLFVTGILFIIEKIKLPIDGAEDAANVIALALIGSLSWLFVKYVAPLIKTAKGSGVALLALAVSLSLSNVSCTALDVSVDKSKLKSETETHAIYPSSAIKPLVNREEADRLFQDGIDKVNQSLIDATK